MSKKKDKKDREEFDAVLAQHGESFDIDETNAIATVNLSDEAERLLTTAAAKKGVDLQTYLDKVSQHLMDKIMAARGADHAEFLPWSREEYERRKDDVLAEGGLFFDLDQSTGTLKMSISPEAENRLTKAAAKMGMDLDTYLNQICQHYVDQVLAEERAAKV
jgi:plasmid stability protein